MKYSASIRRSLEAMKSMPELCQESEMGGVYLEKVYEPMQESLDVLDGIANGNYGGGPLVRSCNPDGRVGSVGFDKYGQF